VPTRPGWLHLSAVLDLYASQIVGWAMGERVGHKLVSAALRMALVAGWDLARSSV
jgi:hypothetical protein